MIADNDLKIGQQRVLDTDSHLIVSSLRSTKFLVNALDVLHSFVILSTGIKVDAIVGRINEMSVFFLREGLFFGQCSEYVVLVILVCLLLLKVWNLLIFLDI